MDDSLFLKIPAELRVRIFEESLIGKDPIVIASVGERVQHRPAPTSERRLAASLLSVCRQFNSECASIFYGSNRFLLRVQKTRPDEQDIFRRWKEAVGRKNLNLVRHITFELTCATVEMDSTPSTVHNEISAVNALRSLSHQVEGLGPRCIALIQLVLVSYHPGPVESQPSERSFDVIVEARDLRSSLRACHQEMKRTMRATKAVDEHMEMFIGQYYVGLLMGLLD